MTTETQDADERNSTERETPPGGGDGVLVRLSNDAGFVAGREIWKDYEIHPSGNVVTLYTEDDAFDVPMSMVQHIWHEGQEHSIPKDYF